MYRSRISYKLFLKIVLASCVALLYLQFQLLSDTERNHLIDVLQLKKEESIPESVQWEMICNLKNGYLKNDGFKENKTGNLNVLVWEDIIGSSINSLLRQPMFPRQPSKILITTGSAYVNLNSIHYGQWIVGYLHVDLTGEFKFALSSDDSSELWLSTGESAENARRIARVGDGDLPGWTRLGQHSKYVHQISSPITLKKCKKYFIEVIHKQSVGEGFVAISWKRPGAERFHVISGAYLSPLLWSKPNLHFISLTGGQFRNLRMAFERQRKNKLSLELSFDYVEVGRLDTKLTKSVGIPTCVQGTQVAHQSITDVYPAPGRYIINISSKTNADDKMLKELQGKKGVLSKKVVKAIVGRYLALLEQANPGRFSLESINSVEYKKYRDQRERFLLDLTLKNNQQKIKLRTANYIYRSWTEDLLCLADELHWGSNTHVQIILIIVNAEHGKWAINLIDNIEDICKRTKNNNIHLTVVQLGKKEFNFEWILKVSSLPRHNLIYHEDVVNFAKAIQRAIDSIEETKSISLIVDPRMKLPMDIFELTRKHCFQGKMAFSPIAFHLAPGMSPAEPEGHWNNRVSTMLAMFKDDWRRFLQHGGTDQQNNDLKSFERRVESIMEVERIKVEDLFFLNENEELVINNNISKNVIIYS